MITADLDGITVPIETLIDARQFIRYSYDIEGRLPEIFYAEIQVTGLLPDGSTVQGFARDIPWHDVIACRGRSGEAAQCSYCDQWEALCYIEETEDGLMCYDCTLESGFYGYAPDEVDLPDGGAEAAKASADKADAESTKEKTK
mgnify:CR=1 FL=1